MSRETLAEYVNDQLAKRQWSKRELARQANITPTSALRCTNPEYGSPPGFDVLNEVARAFRIRPEKLFILAGLYPREPEQTTQERHLLTTFRQLPVEHQRTLIEFCDYLFTVRSRLFPVLGPDYEEDPIDGQ